MSLRDEVDTYEAPQRIWAAVIATDPGDLSERVSVVIPALDVNLRWDDCRWQSRDTTSLPSRGDPCVVVTDDNGEVWVVAWWPFTT